MALKPNETYPSQIDNSDPTGYPHGKARNVASPGDGTGTPWEEQLANDIFGMQQALLDEAAVTPSGNPDKVGASQYLEALDRLYAPTVIEVTGNGTIDLTDYPWAKWAYVEAVGGGAGGRTGSGGGGSGYKAEGWVSLIGQTSMGFTIGAGGAANAAGGDTTVTVGLFAWKLVARGAPAVPAPDPGVFPGGDGYSGGGGRGAGGGEQGSDGDDGADGEGGSGIAGVVGSGSGYPGGASGGGAGGTGGGGGAGGHWPGVSASDGADGTGTGAGTGGRGGTGVGAGGGGGGALGSFGTDGAGGAGARGGARVYLFRVRPL